MADFKWVHYLELAEDLFGRIPDQPKDITSKDLASIRCIISRSYYAAHWCSRNYLKNEYFYEPEGRDQHSQVVAEMKEHCSTLKSIANQLHTLKTQRINADYHVAVAFDKRAAESAIMQARNILDRLSNLKDCK